MEVNLLETGRFAYRVGNFRDAIAAWEQVGGGGSDRALALNYLALAYHQLGEKNRANTTIQECLELIENLKNSSEKRQLFARALNTEGRLYFSEGETRSALEQWRKAEEFYVKSNDSLGQIGTRINQAQALQILGNYRQALQILKGLEKAIEQEAEPIKTLGFLSLGNALQSVGDLERSRDDILEKYLLPIVQQDTLEPSTLTGNILMSFGNLNRALLKLRRSRLYFDEVDEILIKPSNPIELGNNIARFSCYQKTENKENLDISKLYKNAFCAYRKAEDLFINSKPSDLREMGLQAKLNRFSLATERLKWWRDRAERRGQKQAIFVQSLDREVEEMWQDIQRQNLFNTLPVGRRDISMRLNLVESVLRWRDDLSGEMEKYLSDALTEARKLEDLRFESYTLGKLGILKHQEHYDKAAKEKLQKALDVSQSIHAWDITYQWQWQLGRIYRDRDELNEAERYYQLAINNLENLQARDLVAIDTGLDGVNSDLQVSFREKVEPVYREYVDLLLKPQQPSQENLRKARLAIDQLQLAQLKDFLRCDPQNSKSVEIDKIIDDQKLNSAVVYPIVLQEQIGIILKLPRQQHLIYRKFVYKKENIRKIDVERILNQLRPQLETPYIFRSLEKNSSKVYRWLIEPIQNDLEKSQSDTLVFVVDSLLQNLPLAALYNNATEEYLIEKYAIVLNPGLELAKEPTAFKELTLNPLLVGLSEDPKIDDFEELEFVEQELRDIEEILGDVTQILNEDFTEEKLRQELALGNYNLVHIATHGQFNSNPEETFLVTTPNLERESPENKLKVNELDNLLQIRRQSIANELQLLILSACQTATVDNRATLGLAGIAIRAGARSTIASLWNLNDLSTAEFMKIFYQNLIHKKMSKAKALQQAQLIFLKNSEYRDRYKHPIYWAPYILIGNWL
ncbi:MAG: CHAT domain-containing protein [Cyanobacteria bacterium SBLK]|nr:CHAT domain-containing protein [Cyanobacteria bacterium SBLK]